MIERPDKGKDQTWQRAVGNLFEDPSAKQPDETLEGCAAERKEAKHEVDRVVIVKEFVAGAHCKLVTDGHFTDGRRTNNEHESRFLRNVAHA